MWVELTNQATQLDSRCIRQPVVQDVKVEAPPPGQAQPLIEVASANDLTFCEIERHYFPGVFVVVDQKDVFSLSVGIRHICAADEEESNAAIPMIVSALIPVPA